MSASFLHKVFIAFLELKKLSDKFNDSKNFFNRYCSLFFGELAYDIVISNLSKNERRSIIKDYSDCAKYSNPDIKSKIYYLWFKLARNRHFTLTYIYTMMLRFLLNLK